MGFDHVFDRLDIDAKPFALCELQGRCDMGLPRRSTATLHYVLAGDGEVAIRGRPAIPVTEGTLVLVPATQTHTLRSFGAGGHPIPDCHPAELDLVHHLGGRGGSAADDKLLAICSQVVVGFRGVGDLIDLVREPIVEQVVPGGGIARSVDQLLKELSSPRLGSRAMVRALLLQGVIQLLRNRLDSGDPALVWMSALADQKLWSALRRMLDCPGDQHTVESLAEAAGMSRSTFAKRFSDAYGNGPMELLRNLRVRHAAALLSDTDLPVKRVAERVGFQSRSAFTRAFENAVGVAPGVFRSGSRGT